MNNPDFTNLVSPIHLQELAEADAVKEQVHEVQVCHGLIHATGSIDHVLWQNMEGYLK